MSTPTQPTIDPERLARVTQLRSGAHRRWTRAGGCLLEMAGWVAGEPWNDHPKCVCPVLANYGRHLNDAMDDITRQRLLPYVPKLVGTRGSTAVVVHRAYIAIDYAVRVFAPLALTTAGLPDEATALRALAPVTSPDTALAAAHAVSAAMRVARSFGAAADPTPTAVYLTAESNIAYWASSIASRAASVAYGASSIAYRGPDAANPANEAVAWASKAAYVAVYTANVAVYTANVAGDAAWDAALACFDAMLAVTEEAAA